MLKTSYSSDDKRIRSMETCNKILRSEFVMRNKISARWGYYITKIQYRSAFFLSIASSNIYAAANITIHVLISWKHFT